MAEIEAAAATMVAGAAEVAPEAAVRQVDSLGVAVDGGIDVISTLRRGETSSPVNGDYFASSAVIMPSLFLS